MPFFLTPLHAEGKLSIHKRYFSILNRDGTAHLCAVIINHKSINETITNETFYKFSRTGRCAYELWYL